MCGANRTMPRQANYRAAKRLGHVMLAVLSLLVAHGILHPTWAEADSPARSPQGECHRAQFRAIVDVGHTAEVPGATSARGAAEYTFNLRLAREIKQQLIDAGFVRTVLLVTAGPTRAGLAKRVASANRSSADLFLSIHHDSVPDRFLETWKYEGRELYFSDRFKGHSIFISNENSEPRASLLFGRLLGNQLKERGLQYAKHYTEPFMGRRRRELVDEQAGVYRYDQLIVLKDTRIPAVLLEAGSIINRDEEVEMASAERRSLIAQAVSDAVEKFCAARSPRHPDELHAGAAHPAKQAVRGATPPVNPRR